jgi:hypothetical protein
MDNDTFERLKKIAESEVKFDDKDAAASAQRVPNLYQRYLDIYVSELRDFKLKKIELDKKYGELYKATKFHDSYEWASKSEIDSQIYANKDYHALRVYINQQEHVVKYLESVLDNIKRLSFSIKNWVDIKKFEHGMF